MKVTTGSSAKKQGASVRKFERISRKWQQRLTGMEKRHPHKIMDRKENEKPVVKTLRRVRGCESRNSGQKKSLLLTSGHSLGDPKGG